MNERRQSQQIKKVLSTGSILVEALVAMGIALIILISISGLFFTGQSNIVQTYQAQQALIRTRNAIDLARVTLYNDWDNILAGTYGFVQDDDSWWFTSGTYDDGVSSHTLIVSDINSEIKMIESNTLWGVKRNNNSSITMTVSRWQEHESQIPGGGG